jgi:tetratricopeptide (TPR) repeat protein
MLSLVALGLHLCSAPVMAQQVPGCGSLQNAFGPFDYRDPMARGENLGVVESYHFTPSVESLTNSQSGTIIGDLDYTLRAFPNHHRALNSVGRYELRGGKDWANASVRSARCYFERGIAFAPDDQVVRMLYANFLAKSGKVSESRRQYEEALQIAPNDPEVNYNVGLFFVGQGDIERARRHAAVAYSAGYPLPGLRRKIEEAQTRQ